MMYGLGTNAAGAKPAGNIPVSKNKRANCSPTTHLSSWLAFQAIDEGESQKGRKNRLRVKIPEFHKDNKTSIRSQ